MKLQRLNREDPENKSFTVTKHRLSNFLKIWHYHPELELVYTLKSSGTRFVGNSIKKFQENDVVLIGKNLPHMWLNDEVYFDCAKELHAEDIVVHFKKEFLGLDIMAVAEMEPIFALMSRASYGIRFIELNHNVFTLIKEMAEMDIGLERVLVFLQILLRLAAHEHYELLCSTTYVNSFKKTQNAILDKTYEFVFQNFAEPIRLQDVAHIANMNPSAFSRFFKRTNQKTFSKYLNEVRIGYACRLLLERESNITAICYESGFNNISNFNRQFRSIMKLSPSAYRLKFNQDVSSQNY